METKICPHCEEDLPLLEFGIYPPKKNNKRKEICKLCCSVQSKHKYNTDNKDRINKSRRERYQLNKSKEY